MRAAVDLHIHSCLSPCGDELMTPNNIVNMSLLKELDVIAVTDHNTAGNLPAVCKVAKEAGLAVLPGIEACSSEEVHTLCYFRTLDAAMDFSAMLYGHLPPLSNQPDFFGRQLFMDDQDEITGEEERLLIQALGLSLDELTQECIKAGGVVVPAHINRTSNSLLTSLGFVPPGAPFAALEVSRDLPIAPGAAKGYRVLHSSDAHQLENILERDFFIDGLRAMSARAVFDYLKEAL